MKKSIFFSFIVAFLLCIAVAVDRTKFRTCQDTGFCRNFRHKATPVNLNEMFRVESSSIRLKDHHLSAQLTPPDDASSPLTLDLHFLSSGAIRFRVSEQQPRYQPLDLLMKEGMLEGGSVPCPTASLPPSYHSIDPKTFSAFLFTPPAPLNPSTTSEDIVVVLDHSPVKLSVFRGAAPVIVVNHNQLMHFQQSKGQKEANVEVKVEVDRHKGKEVVDYGEDGLAIYADGTKEEKAAAPVVAADEGGESFGGHTDNMPRGHRSVGIDISFPQAEVLYGLPEHTSPLALPSTLPSHDNQQPRYSDPYRLYNLDVFEYELDSPMALYGHVPVLYAHGVKDGKGVSAGVYWFNPSETFVDLQDRPTKTSHFMSESGLIDLFLLPGSSHVGTGVGEVVRQYLRLTGSTPMPPIWSLGYHQCRWNYKSEREVLQVNSRFEELDFPYDVIWLDIEHTRGKRYFTWDYSLFPTPIAMQQNISSYSRKMVTIIDPHIKTDPSYHIHQQAREKGLYIKSGDGRDFDGWCWPGESSYLDFTDSSVRDFWAEQFRLEKYEGSTMDLYTWNDMNEPSVFNGPEVSMPKTALNKQGQEHREWHNLYGLYMQMASVMGQFKRQEGGSTISGWVSSLLGGGDQAGQAGTVSPYSTSPSPLLPLGSDKVRPFVLTRAFFGGSQRFGAMWTGDNKADWGHLQTSLPMLMSLNLGGIFFGGADVGGFFGNGDAELFLRWFQLGVFYPFFRGHAHHDTRRKEPWEWNEQVTTLSRHASLLRYSILPYLYTLFWEGYVHGLPVWRPLSFVFPNNPAVIGEDRGVMVGGSLLVWPVVRPGDREIRVRFPVTEQAGTWVELESMRGIAGSDGKGASCMGGVCEVPYPVTLATIPAFIKPGSIFPRKLRVRRSAPLMHYDPYTLAINPDGQGQAQGALYMDDGSTHKYGAGEYAFIGLTYQGGKLKGSRSGSFAPFDTPSFTMAAAVADSKDVPAPAPYSPSNTIERVVIASQPSAPRDVVVRAGGVERSLSFTHDASSKVLVIKKPDVKVAEDFEIELKF